MRTDEARRMVRLLRRHNPGYDNIEVYARLAEADISLVEGDSQKARRHLDNADALKHALDDEGVIFRDVLDVLAHAGSDPSAEARSKIDSLKDRLANSSFAFRTEEFLRRACGVSLNLSPR